LEKLARTADAVAAGDLSARAEPSGIAEVDTVAHAQNTMVDRLSGVLDHARLFAGEAAHQLRTPLAGLRLTLESAQADPAADTRAALDAALQRTAELQRTVQDVLELSRLPDEGPRGPLGSIDELFSDAEHLWHGLLAERGRRVEFAIDEQVGTRRIPRANGRQIIDVLVDNARTHGNGTVRVHAHDVLDAIAIDVRDEGSIADDFRQSPGIGLKLARDLAESAGGRLVLATPSPTTFRLLIQDHPSPTASPGR
jgi:signal transduction histidine kinase